MKAEPITTEHTGFTTELDDVDRAKSLGDVLQASSSSVNMCGCCGGIFLGGHDRQGRQFVAMPIDADTARAIAANLIAFAAESDKLGRGRAHKH